MSRRTVIASIATVLVLVGLADMPYGYYSLLRLTVCGFSLFLLFGDDALDVDWQQWVTGGCAVLYNPILPVTIGVKGIWIVLNVATIGWFWFLSTQADRLRSR